MSTDPPFFIVGCGRSGTSLLRGLLNNHPQIAIPLESLFIADYLRAEGRRPLERLKALLVGEPEIREWGLHVEPGDLADCESLPEAIAHLHELYAASRGKSRWGQKTPRLVRQLALLSDRFPKAKFIHITRDPRAVASSLTRSNVHRSTPLHAAARWKRDVQAGLEFEMQRANRMLRLRYEDLVANPEQTLHLVTDFLGFREPIGAARLAGGGTEYSEFYAQIHANLNHDLTADYVDRWKRDLTIGETQLVESIAMPLMQELGYEPTTTGGRPPTGLAFRMRLKRLAGILLQIWHYLRYRRRYLVHLIWRKRRLGLLREFLGELSL